MLISSLILTTVLPVQSVLAQGPGATAASNLKAAKDFKAELLYTVPKDTEGSWVAMCVDP